MESNVSGKGSSEHGGAKHSKKEKKIRKAEVDLPSNEGSHNKKSNLEIIERQGHTAFEVTKYGIPAMFVVGGADSEGRFCRELREFDFESLSFLPPSEAQFLDHGRHFHTSVVFNNSIYLFGGKINGRSCAEDPNNCENGNENEGFVYSLDMNKKRKNSKWVRLEATGEVPSARYGHSACVWGDKMIVFGGTTNEDEAASKDMFMFDLQRHSWEHITPKTQVTPAARFHHTCIVVHDKMFLFGGHDADNNVWEFDLLSHTWSEIKVKGTKPTARYGHTWTWAGGDLAPTLLMYGGTNGKEVYNQMWSFNLTDKSWKSVPSEKKKASGPVPRRYFHSALVVRDFLIVFGGYNKQRLAVNDFIKIPIRMNIVAIVPEEIMMKVFEKLDPLSLSRANTVCQPWHTVSNNIYLWRDLVCTKKDRKKPEYKLHEDVNNTEPNKKHQSHSVHDYKTMLKYVRLKTALQKERGEPVDQLPGLKIKLLFIGPQQGEYIPMTFDPFSVHKIHDGTPAQVWLWDVWGGPLNYEGPRRAAYFGTDVFVFAFSLVSPTSLHALKTKWYHEVVSIVPDATILLVGTKADLRDNPDTLQSMREQGTAPISDEQAEELRKELGAKAYIACSAWQEYNIDKVVDTATAIAFDKILNSEEEPDKKKCSIM